jgi:NitT/TauT family transport system permease protein
VHLYNAKVYLETPELFAWTATIIILSVSIEKLLVSLLHHM